MKSKKGPSSGIAQAILDTVMAKDDVDEASDQEDDTRAKVVDDENDSDDDIFTRDLSSARPSQLRVMNASTLDVDGDPRYSGRKSSRKSIASFDDDDDDDDDSDSDDEDEAMHESEHKTAELGFMFEMEGVEYDDEDNGTTGRKKVVGKAGKFPEEPADCDSGDGTDEDDDSDDGEEDDDGDDNEDDEDEDDDMGPDLSELNEAEDGIDTFSKAGNNEVAKGRAINNQRAIWDTLLEIRIVLQKSLVKVNRLPPAGETWPAFMAGLDGGGDEAKRCEAGLAGVLEKLLRLRSTLTRKSPAEGVGGGEALPPAKKRRKLAEYETVLSSSHADMRPWRNLTMENWNDRTRTAAKSNEFDAFETSAVRQVEHLLADKERLVGRTRVRRTAYEVLGRGENDGEQTSEETFDDDDFYHQLLRELIERKTAGVTDPVQLGQQWLQLQRVRSKAKKKVDTKASKGRRTRYDIHAKLVNFLAPVHAKSCLTEDAKNELFASLFKHN